MSSHNDVHLKILLKAAAFLGDPSRVKLIWNSRNQAWKLTSDIWAALTEAAVYTDNLSFLNQQLEMHGSSHVRQQIEIGKAIYKQRGELSATDVTNEETRKKCLAVTARLSAALKEFKDLMENCNYKNLKEHPPKSLSIWHAADLANEDWQKRLYDELTLDPAVAATQHIRTETATLPHAEQETTDVMPLEGPTGIPFDELRYQNWKGINELLGHAELFEARYERLAAEAIAEGRAIKMLRSAHEVPLKRMRQHITRGHLTAHLRDLRSTDRSAMTESEWRDKILRLRRVKRSESD